MSTVFDYVTQSPQRSTSQIIDSSFSNSSSRRLSSQQSPNSEFAAKLTLSDEAKGEETFEFSSEMPPERGSVEQFLESETVHLRDRLFTFSETYLKEINQTLQGIKRSVDNRDREIARLKKVHEQEMQQKLHEIEELQTSLDKETGRRIHIRNCLERAAIQHAHDIENKYANKWLGICFDSWRKGVRDLREASMRKQKAKTFHVLFMVKKCFSRWRTFTLFNGLSRAKDQWTIALEKSNAELAGQYEQAIQQLQQQLFQAQEQLRKEKADRTAFHTDLRNAVFRGVTALNQETMKALQARADLGLDLPPPPGIGTGFPGPSVAAGGSERVLLQLGMAMADGIAAAGGLPSSGNEQPRAPSDIPFQQQQEEEKMMIEMLSQQRAQQPFSQRGSESQLPKKRKIRFEQSEQSIAGNPSKRKSSNKVKKTPTSQLKKDFIGLTGKKSNGENEIKENRLIASQRGDASAQQEREREIEERGEEEEYPGNFGEEHLPEDEMAAQNIPQKGDLEGKDEEVDREEEMDENEEEEEHGCVEVKEKEIDGEGTENEDKDDEEEDEAERTSEREMEEEGDEMRSERERPDEDEANESLEKEEEDDGEDGEEEEDNLAETDKENPAQAFTPTTQTSDSTFITQPRPLRQFISSAPNTEKEQPQPTQQTQQSSFISSLMTDPAKPSVHSSGLVARSSPIQSQNSPSASSSSSPSATAASSSASAAEMHPPQVSVISTSPSSQLYFSTDTFGAEGVDPSQMLFPSFPGVNQHQQPLPPQPARRMQQSDALYSQFASNPSISSTATLGILQQQQQQQQLYQQEQFMANGFQGSAQFRAPLHTMQHIGAEQEEEHAPSTEVFYPGDMAMGEGIGAGRGIPERRIEQGRAGVLGSQRKTGKQERLKSASDREMDRITEAKRMVEGMSRTEAMKFTLQQQQEPLPQPRHHIGPRAPSPSSAAKRGTGAASSAAFSGSLPKQSQLQQPPRRAHASASPVSTVIEKIVHSPSISPATQQSTSFSDAVVHDISRVRRDAPPAARTWNTSSNPRSISKFKGVPPPSPQPLTDQLLHKSRGL